MSTWENRGRNQVASQVPITDRKFSNSLIVMEGLGLETIAGLLRASEWEEARLCPVVYSWKLIEELNKHGLSFLLPL